MRKIRNYLFIFIFLMLFGINTIKADSLPNNITVDKNTNMRFTKSGYFDFYGKTSMIPSESGQPVQRYVFCLESNRDVAYGNSGYTWIDTLNPRVDLYRDKLLNLNRIYSKAYKLGLGRKGSEYTVTIGNTSYNTSDSEMYLITQMAIWKTTNGESANGLKPGHQLWLDEVGHKERRRAIFDTLVNAAQERDDSEITYYINVTGSGMNVEDGFLVSNEYIVSSNVPSDTPPSDAPLTLHYTGDRNDVMVKVGDGQWITGDIIVTDGSRIKVSVPKPDEGSGEVSLSFSISSSSFSAGWNTGIYKLNDTNQNIMVTVPIFRSKSTSFKTIGNYTNSGEVLIEKVDLETGNKIADAEIGVYSSDNSLITTFVSTTQNKSLSLPIGDYYLKELKAPSNYVLDSTPVPFSIVDDNGTIRVRQNNQFVESGIITLTNSKRKIVFKKVDESGNELSGVELRIGSYNEKTVLNNPDHLRICGVTASDGLLKNPCSDLSNANNYVNTSGQYELGDDIYYIHETFKDGFYDEDFKEYDIAFSYSNGNVITLGPNVSVSENDNVITVTIKNHRYIDISKSDINGQNEIPGAQMRLYDKSIPAGGFEEGTLEDEYQYLNVDSWTSGTKSHRISGIIPGHTYLLIEDVAPAGYVRITTRIEFTMDSEGNITLGDQDVSASTSGYHLTVKNDYTKVTFSKTDATGEKELAGAHLKICTKDKYEAQGNICEAYVEWDSEETAKEIDMLPVGEYYLIETTAPVGYVQQTNAVGFEVLETSVVQPVKFKNEPTKVVISKKDATTEEELPGAHLKICSLAAYQENGKDCEPFKEDLDWVSTDEPNYIEALPFGDYVLIETLPPSNYVEGMFIEGKELSAYEFSLTAENYNITIDVYNKLLVKVPNTGISLINLFAIGGLMIFIGYETIKIYRRRTYLNLN